MIVRCLRRYRLPPPVAWIAVALVPACLAPQAAIADGGAGPLFDSMMEALGGRDAVGSIRSLTAEAVCSGPDGPFITEVQSIRNERTYFRQAADDRAMRLWATTSGVWRSSPSGELEPLPAEFAAFLRGHEFHFQVLDVESRFSGHRVAGPEELEGEPTLRIEMTDEQAEPAVLWLHRETRLPVALETNPHGAAGPVRVVYRRWAPWAGVQLFRAFDLSEGEERRFRYDYVRLSMDAPLAERFEAPPMPRGSEEAGSQELDEIEAVLARDRAAHLASDAGLLGQSLAEELVEVSAGEVALRTRAEVLESLAESFRGAVFHRWEDTMPPLVRFSEDRTLAWVVRRVRADREGADGARAEYVSAYSATYRRVAGRWLMTSVTSTFLPAE